MVSPSKGSPHFAQLGFVLLAYVVFLLVLFFSGSFGCCCCGCWMGFCLLALSPTCSLGGDIAAVVVLVAVLVVLAGLDLAKR